MPASSTTLRTYGKRAGAKRKQDLDNETNSKRRKVLKSSDIRPRSPSRPSESERVDTDVELFNDGSSTPVKPKKVSRIHGTTSSGSPSRLVRDLSGIFESMSPGRRSPSATPTKLAKRMLGRSRTESSVDAQSPLTKEQHSSNLDRTVSLPNFPLASSSPTATPEPLSSYGNIHSTLSRPTIFNTATSSASKTSTTRTYAGKYRSFLMALPASSSSSTGVTTKGPITNEDEFETRESYNSLRTRWGVDNSEDDPRPPYEKISSPSNNSTTTVSEASPARVSTNKGKAVVRTVSIPDGMMNPLKSITELRHKGESRRFLDEMGYLFEGLDPKCGLSLRQSSALEITTKLCDPEFIRKAKATDFFSRTWELLLVAGAGKGNDKILDFLLVFFLALVARDSISLAELAERPNKPDSLDSDSQQQEQRLVDVLILILETVTSGDILGLSSSVVPKKDRSVLSSIQKVVTSKSKLFPSSTPMSTPLLITSILLALPPSYLSISFLPTLLDSLRNCLSGGGPNTLQDALSSAQTETGWLETVGGIPYESAYNHLRLLDTCLVGQWTAAVERGTFDPDRDGEEVDRCFGKVRDEWMVRDLVAFGVCSEIKLGQDDEDDTDSIHNGSYQKCFTLTLRVLISLTHNNTAWAEGVIRCKMTMGLILRTVCKTGKEILLTSNGEDDGDGDDGDEDERKERRSQAFDTLCLVLGLLTNLVQAVEDSKDVLRRTRLNVECGPSGHTCLERCVCSSSERDEERGQMKKKKKKNGVEILVWLYQRLERFERDLDLIRRQKKEEKEEEEPELTTKRPEQQSRKLLDQGQESENEAQSSFLCGHLSVLFGLLMMGKLGMKNRGLILGLINDGLRSSTTTMTTTMTTTTTTTTTMKNDHREQPRQRHQRVRLSSSSSVKQMRGHFDDDEEGSSDTLNIRRYPPPAVGIVSEKEDSEETLGLERLVRQAREFEVFYSVVSRKMMTVMVMMSDQSSGGGSKVVRKVVEFLEGLRDT